MLYVLRKYANVSYKYCEIHFIYVYFQLGFPLSQNLVSFTYIAVN